MMKSVAVWSSVFCAGIFLSSCAVRTVHDDVRAPAGTAEEERPPARIEAILSGPAEITPPQEKKTVPFGFDWPVDSARMSRGFLPKKRRPHLGLDLAAPKGTPILAAQSGIVIYRGKDFRGFGRLVMIEHPDGWATLYGHLESFLVEEGQKVKMGDMIGTMGRTGRATGVHLHFEIRRGRVAVDPLNYLPSGHFLSRKKQAQQ